MSVTTQDHCICMVSDFFYPNTGGVENHIYYLSQHLILKGYKVIGITHCYGNRIAIRYLSNYFKVYYLPLPCFYKEVTLPTLIATIPLIRDIVIREGVTIIHGHGGFSTLCAEAMLYGSVANIPTVFTEHSLFHFNELSSVITNKFQEFFLSDVSHVICVSYTSKENTILRAKLNPSIISVIPNAIDSHQFTPDPHPQTNTSKITIVIVSRLVFRKGTDLLGGIIPIICSKHPDVHFLIGGDGPKRILLEEIREKHFLQDRVKLSDGMIPHNLVRDLLIQGNIFLNTSTTESFCIAMLEAACCGLQVVSTNVGGIPEVLPPGMVYLADPTVHCLVEKLEVAIKAHREGTAISPLEKHKLIKDLYTWSSVADRTEMIYNRLTYRPHTLLSQKLLKYYNRDESILVGTIYMMVMVLLVMIHYILDWLRPSNLIDKVPPGIHKEMINKKKK